MTNSGSNVTATKIVKPDTAKFKPGLSGNDCSLDLMITDTQGRIWTNLPNGSLSKVVANSKGQGVMQYGSDVDQPKGTQLITKPNLIAEGFKFYVSDSKNRIYGFSQGYNGWITPQQADRNVNIFVGDRYNGEDHSGASIWGAIVNGKGMLSVTDPASGSGGGTGKANGLTPYQYLPSTYAVIYGTDHGSYYLDSSNYPVKVEGNLTPGLIIRAGRSSSIRTDSDGDIYVYENNTIYSIDQKIKAPVKFLPNSGSVFYDHAEPRRYAIGVNGHVYSINASADRTPVYTVSDTGVIVDISLHAGLSSQQQSPIVSYDLTGNITKHPDDITANVTVSSPTGSPIPTGWTATQSENTVKISLPADWTVPDSATYDVDLTVKPTKPGRVQATDNAVFSYKDANGTPETLPYDDLFVTGVQLLSKMPSTGVERQSVLLTTVAMTAGFAGLAGLRRRRVRPRL